MSVTLSLSLASVVQSVKARTCVAEGASVYPDVRNVSTRVTVNSTNVVSD